MEIPGVFLGDQGGKVVRPVWCGARAREAEMARRVGLQFGRRQREREEEEDGLRLTSGARLSAKEREREARARGNGRLTGGPR